MTREELVTLHLQNYADGRRELAKIEELLSKFKYESLDDTIAIMNFMGTDAQEPVQTSTISDPTFRIACMFRQANRQNNEKAKQELQTIVEETRRGLDMVKSCVSMLRGRTKRIIQLLYFDDIAWDEVGVIERISKNSIQYHRKKAIEEMANMTPYLSMLFDA